MELSIDFYKQEEASLFIESNTHGDKQEFAEVLLFSCLALRQMHALNKKYALLLMNFLQRIGLDSNEFLETVTNDSEFPRLVDYRGTAGRKGFKAVCKFEMDRAAFTLDAKGFGFLMRGINYYAPHSVILLFRFLLVERAADSAFADRLVEACRVCAMVYDEGQVNTFSQTGLSVGIARHAFGYSLPPIGE